MNEYLLASPQRMTYVAPVFGPTMLASIADDAQADLSPMKDALVAQLDRALDYESRGQGFESSRAHQKNPWTVVKYMIFMNILFMTSRVYTILCTTKHNT